MDVKGNGSSKDMERAIASFLQRTSTTQEDELISAIERKNVGDVVNAIMRGADVAAADNYPIKLAIARGRGEY